MREFNYPVFTCRSLLCLCLLLLKKMAVIIVILLVLLYQQVLFATDPCKGTFLGSQNYKADWTVEGSTAHFVVTANVNVSNNWWIALGFSENNDSQQNFMVCLSCLN